MVQLRKITSQLDEMGYQIIGISPDKPEILGETAVKYKLHYRLLSDKTMTAARSFGVAFQIVDKPPDYYEKLERASGERHYQLPVPAVFIVDTDNTTAIFDVGIYRNKGYSEVKNNREGFDRWA